MVIYSTYNSLYNSHTMINTSLLCNIINIVYCDLCMRLKIRANKI